MVFSSNEDSCKHDPRFLRYYTTKQRTKRTFIFLWHMTNAAVLRFFVPEGLKKSSAGVFQNPAKCPASLRLIVQRPRGKKYTCWFVPFGRPVFPFVHDLFTHAFVLSSDLCPFFYNFFTKPSKSCHTFITFFWYSNNCKSQKAYYTSLFHTPPFIF